MKKIILLFAFCLLFFSCKKNQKQQLAVDDTKKKQVIEQSLINEKEVEQNNNSEKKSKTLDEKFHNYLETGDLSFLEGKYIYAKCEYVMNKDEYYDFTVYDKEYIEIRKSSEDGLYYLDWCRNKNFYKFPEPVERSKGETEIVTGIIIKNDENLKKLRLKSVNSEPVTNSINLYTLYVGLRFTDRTEFINFSISDIDEDYGFFYRPSDIDRYNKIVLKRNE